MHCVRLLYVNLRLDVHPFNELRIDLYYNYFAEVHFMSNTFDWNNFNKLFQQFFPQGNMNELGTGLDLSWVNKHIEETLNQSLPNKDAKDKPAYYNSEIVDIHNYIIVKIKVSESQARSLAAAVSSTQLKLLGDTSKPQQVIQLPAFVKPDSGKAIYKNGVLEIRLLKREKAERFSDIDIHFL